MRFRPLIILFSLLVVLVPASMVFAKAKAPTGFNEALSYGDLVQKYAEATSEKPVRILVVPGHEPDFGGAVYQGVYEREIVVEIADQLTGYLKNNSKFEVIVARSNTEWSGDLAAYFQNDWLKIQRFVTAQKKLFAKLVNKGSIETRGDTEQVDHAAAPSDVALRLYGIGTWADKNAVDIVVHLHINDSPDHGPNNPSAHSGFAVYIPDHQYGNAAASRPLGEAIARHIGAMNATSTLPIENQAVIEDQELIALGAYGTLRIPSALVEYGYITESKFTHPEVRQTITNDFAYQTYLGIQDYFQNPVSSRFPTVSLPYTFTGTPKVGSSSPEVYTLQAALHTIGFYPVSTTTVASRETPATTTLRTLEDCPISGFMGECTTDAIKAFQVSKGLKPTGTIGPLTLQTLNALFSSSPLTLGATVSTAMTSAAASSGCDLPTRTMALNDTDIKTNGDVSRLQKLLSTDTKLYPEKLITGTFGPATLRAVERFQTAETLAVPSSAGYGLVGPKTRAALEELCTVGA